MPINLSKGQKVDLTKKNPGLKKIMAGLGWDVNAFDSGSDFDLDAAAFTKSPVKYAGAPQHNCFLGIIISSSSFFRILTRESPVFVYV